MGAEITELIVRGKDLTDDMFKSVIGGMRRVRDASRETGEISAKEFGPLGKAVGDIGGAFASLGGIMGGLAIGSVAADFVEFTGNLSDLSDKTDISIRQLQRFGYAGGLAGIAMEQIAGASDKLSVNLGNDDAGTIGAINTLGLNLDEIRAMNPGDRFEEIASKVSQIEDPSKRAALAVQLFGRSGVELMPLLKQNLKEVGDEAERVGAVLSDDVVKSGDDLGDLWTKLKAASRSLVAEGLRPVLETVRQINDPGELARWEKFKDALHVKDIAAEWRELAAWIQASKDAGAGSTGTLAAPKAPAAFNAKANGLQALPMSVADMLKLGDALDADREKFNKATKAADDHAEAITKLAEKYRGLDGVKSAKDAVEAFTQAQRQGFSISQMSREDAIALNKVMSDAIGTYQRSGQAIPEEWVRIANATALASQQGVADITELVQIMEDLKQVALTMPAQLVPTIDVTKGFGGLDLDALGTKIGALSRPKVSLAAQLFGTPQQFGQDLSGTILGALQGGGNPVAAAAGMIGKTVGGNVAKSLTAEGGPLFKKALGGVLSSALPVVGSLVAPLAGALWNKLFGSAGRDAVKDFAAQFETFNLDTMKSNSDGFDNLHKKLLDLSDPAYGEKLWKALTQGVGHNNPEQAREVIELINKALSEQKTKIDDVASAAQDSGAKVTAAQQAVLDKLHEQIDGIDQEMTSLQESIANEAPEEEIGVVEQATRKRLEALADQRKKLEEELQAQQQDTEQATADTGNGVDDVNKKAEKTRDTFEEWAEAIKRARGELDGMQFPSGAPGGGSMPAHATGAYIREDHVAAVHAGEIVGPVDFMSRALAGAMARTGAAGGYSGPERVVVMLPDRRVLAEVVLREQSRVLASNGGAPR